MKTRERTSLTSRQLAEALGVSESSVKRWVDEGEIEAHRTSGGHRRIPMAAAVGFIRRQGVRVERPEVLALAATPSFGTVDASAADHLYNALFKDDAEEACALLSGRYIGGANIATIADALVRPALSRMGELWRDDPEGVLIEHRAVQTCIAALSDLESWLPALPKHAPVAVAAAGPGDPYLLPPMLASMTLRESGFRARNLGPMTPLSTVALAAEKYGSSVCSVSVSIAQDRKSQHEWEELSARLDATRTRLVIGGRCVKSIPASVLAQVQVCGSMSELASYVTGVAHGAVGGRHGTEGRKS